MTGIVERVYDAIALALEKLEKGKIEPHEVARAAIKAMREPTNEMIWASMNAKDRGTWWRAMIDAALNEQE